MNNKEHFDMRAQLWADLTVAYTRADNSSSALGASRWADTILEDFDKRFPAPKEDSRPSFRSSI